MKNCQLQINIVGIQNQVFFYEITYNEKSISILNKRCLKCKESTFVKQKDFPSFLSSKNKE